MLETEKEERPQDLNICKMNYWLTEAKTMMEVLAMLCDGVKGLRGPQIPSHLALVLNSGHQHRRHLVGRVFKRV